MILGFYMFYFLLVPANMNQRFWRTYCLLSAAIFCFSSFINAQDNDSDPELVSANGIVVDQNDRPIKNAVVYLREWPTTRISDIEGSLMENRYMRRDYCFSSTKTDAEGRFEFNEVRSPLLVNRTYNQPSRWTVVAAVPGRALAWQKLSAANNAEPIKLVVAPGKSIEGTVKDQSGRAVQGADVHVIAITEPGGRRYDLIKSNTQFYMANSELSGRATTDENGQFKIDNLPANKRIDLCVLHEQYAPAFAFAGTTPDKQPDVQERPLRAGQQMESFPVQMGNVQMVLQRGVRLNVQVVDADHQPVQDQEVTVRAEPSSERITAFTDAEGRFTTPRLADEHVRLYIYQPSVPGYTSCDKIVALEHSRPEQQIVFQLPKAKTIKGRLLADDSEPIAGVKVYYFPTDLEQDLFDRHLNTCVSGENGEFEFQVAEDKGLIVAVGLLFGYELPSIAEALRSRRNPENPAPASAPVQLDGQDVDDFKLTVQRARRITGKVVDHLGVPVPNASIKPLQNAFRGSSQFYRMSPLEIDELFATKTDQEGNFTVAGVPRINGIHFTVHSPGKRLVALMDLDDLKKLSDITVQLEPAVTLHGTTTLDGEPLAAVAVEVKLLKRYTPDESGRYHLRTIQWGRVDSDMSGEFTIDGLPPAAQYSINAERNSRDSQSLRIKPEEGQLSIEVPEIKFVSLNAEIRGTVVTPKGEPVVGVSIEARNVETRQRYETYVGDFEPIKTDKDGKFVIQHLPADTRVNVMVFPDRKEYRKASLVVSKVEAMTGTKDLKIVFDPRLDQAPPIR